MSGYNAAHFSNLFVIEDRHFWFRARNEVISLFASQLVSRLTPGYRVLEMGCGDGNVLRVLERACNKGKVIGMDFHAEGLRYARRRTRCHLVQGDISQSPFSEKFHLIGVFDVLEHIPDDRRILADLWSLLAPNSALLLTVPAHPHLWSYFDQASGHCRRYDKNELRLKLEEARFTVEYISEYMAIIYPLMWAIRTLRSRKSAVVTQCPNLVAEEVRVLPGINGILTFLLSFESRWLAKRRQLPFGTSLLAVARKHNRNSSERSDLATGQVHAADEAGHDSGTTG